MDAEAQPGIFIGKELAQNLGVMLDDTVVLVSPMGAWRPWEAAAHEKIPGRRDFRHRDVRIRHFDGLHLAGEAPRNFWAWGTRSPGWK